MLSNKLINFILVSAIIASSKVSAAPAMQSSLCEVKAIVVQIKERVHQYRPESWRKNWGLPKSITYTDVTLNLGQISGASNCNKEFFNGRNFQLKKDSDKSKINVGDCILAKTQFSGDEFKIGQWLWDIRACESAQ